MGDSGAYYPDKEVFPPAAKVDEFIAIVRSPTEREYAQVVYLEPIPVYDAEFLLKAAETLSEQELTYIEVGAQEVLQLRIAVLGSAKFNFKLPRAVKRFTLRRDSGWIDENIAPYPRFPPMTELHILEDTHLYVDVQNLNSEHAERAKLYITGWRLVYEPIKERPRAYAALIVQGFAPRSKTR